MAYKALYRTWRPQDFSEVVGQGYISKTLQNAVSVEKVAHAYLFCGPRGTGKTSSAKILAKAINCLNLHQNNPCNKCVNCIAINEGKSLDVLEIDAASNRGIEEIREIKERVKFAPSEGKFKVYIIDEVHMLTSEAFNALLKTLEEPPKHVIFILATTEVQKIPATILSRCQRFDFKKLSTELIEDHLEKITASLGIKVECEILKLLAHKADGGMRDAISLLDQCLAFGGDNLNINLVRDLLGLVDNEFLFDLIELLINKDMSNLLIKLNHVLNQGKDVNLLVRELLGHLRNLLLSLVCDNTSEIGDLDQKNLIKYREQGSKLGLEWLTKSIEIVGGMESEIKWSGHPRVLLETLFIKLFLLKNRNGQQHNVIATEQKINQETRITKEIKEIIQEENVNVSRENINKANIKKQEANKRLSIGSDTSIFKDNWSKILETIRQQRVTVHAFLVPAKIEGFYENCLTLGYDEVYSFHKERIDNQENKQMLIEAIEKVTGLQVAVKLTITKEPEKMGEMDLVQKAIDVFGSDIVQVKE